MTDMCNINRLDAALDPDATGSEVAWAAAHQESCPACRKYLALQRALDARLATLPLETMPERSLWPGIAARLKLLGVRVSAPALRESSAPLVRIAHAHPMTVPWRAAAAIALFAGGFATHQLLVIAQRASTSPALARHDVPARDTANVAAEDLQRLGSEWTASLSRLGHSPASSGEATDQQREVALATLRGAVSELVRIAPDHPGIVAAYVAIEGEHRRIGVSANAERVAF